MVRSLYDCPGVPVGSEGMSCRVVVATHPESSKKSPVGVTRAGIVYELFFTNLPQQAFTASDVVGLYLHRGAFEPALADEDTEQDPDRWCSHSAWGQECWQVVSQWVWNLRLELGHQLEPTPIRITEFAPALPPPSPHTAPPSGYAPPHVGLPWKAGRFSGQDFALQADGTLRCPADQRLSAHEQRREADGSLRVVYGASIRSCRPCPLREQCQWQGSATAKPRQVSVLLHPLKVGAAPLRLRVTGVAGSIDGHVCCSYTVNGLTCIWNRPSRFNQKRQRPYSPVRSEPTIGSHGLSDWPAMLEDALLPVWLLPCSECLEGLLPFSVSQPAER